MQVSVVIPTYNRAHTLLRALNSVLAQSFPLTLPSPRWGEGGGEGLFEVIVVDDGSTDGQIGGTVLKGTSLAGLKLSPPEPSPIKYFYQPNRGPAAARNLGILNSSLEFIAFLDSDDEWMPGKLAAQLRFFEENPDYLICQTEEIWIRNGRRVNPMKKHKKYGGWIFEKCLPLCIVSPSAVMMKREFFEKVGLFDESLPACEDYDLWLRASARFPIGLIEKSYVIKYGGHPDQRSRQFPAMDRFRIQALRKILDSGILNEVQQEAAGRELKRKCEIVTRGGLRRGMLGTVLRGTGLESESVPSRTVPYKPQKIYVEKAAGDFADVRKILSRLPGVPIEEVENVRSLIGRIGDSPQNRGLSPILQTPDPIGEGKRYLLLTRDRGRAFKPFPAPEGTLSCNFHSLHLVEGCNLECSYCILQAYLTNPLLTIYVNVDEILEHLESFLKAHPDRHFRIGTGQLADSLSLDHLTAHTEMLVPFFARQKNAVLELKTKSANVARLGKMDSRGQTLVSWSMNTKRIQQKEEHKCAAIEERLAAARQCIKWGYRVGFHFDPLIDYEGGLEEYEELIEEIFSNIPPEKTAWVSLGSLRFMPQLKSIMEKRFPKSPLPYAEWVRGTDGKMRYFKERRIEMYTRLLARIREVALNVPVYLCMETEEVWKRTVGSLADADGIRAQLDCVLTPSP